MSDLKGTNVASSIVPFTTEDTFATHDALYGKGGYRTVETISERDSISVDRRSNGMVVYVVSDSSGVHTYRCVLLSGHTGKNISDWTWEPDSTTLRISTQSKLSTLSVPPGTLVFVDDEKKLYIYNGDGWKCTDVDSELQGLPIYSVEKIAELTEKDKLPDDYIEINDRPNSEIELPSNLEILFGAIRQLQAEVAKLRNTIKLGIFSCTGKETAASQIMGQLDDVEEEEPLWAVQESELSGLFTLQFSLNTELDPVGDNSVVRPNPGNTSLNIFGEAEFICNNHIETQISDIKDSKIFLYLTATEKNIEIDLVGSEDKQTYTLDLNSILPTSNSTYAILLITSRTLTEELSVEEKAEGKTPAVWGRSFVWLTAQSLANNNNIYESYLNPKSISEEQRTTPLYLGQNYYLDRIVIKSPQANRANKLTKFDIYSKYQDFSDEVEAIRPNDVETVTYKTAHITIRSVETVDILDSIIRQLQENELVYVTGSNQLYIISGGEKRKIGTGGGGGSSITTDDMNVQELIDNLYRQGLINLIDADYDNDGNLIAVSNVELSKIASITLINDKTQESTRYEVDSNGELVGYKETPSKLKFSYNITADSDGNSLQNVDAEDVGFSQKRGFIARYNKVGSSSGDAKLNSDRVKIGAFFAPDSNNTANLGCSHSFIEIENTSDKDYYLDGCYLHYTGGIVGKERNGDGYIYTQATYHLPLKGKLPAGGTFLVRGKQYTDLDSPNTYIKVNTYDLEWYVNKTDAESNDRTSVTFTPAEGYDYSANFGKLLGFEYFTEAINLTYGIALTYGHGKITHETQLVNPTPMTNSVEGSLSLKPFLIDSINIFTSNLKTWHPQQKLNTYVLMPHFIGGNCIYKNTFELDPAKQAFQSYHTKDSSRLRGANAADYMIVELDKEYIQLPNSNDTYPVSKFTPKASWELKNVSTDKTQLDAEKPNMPTVSFGINQTRTRCFNWISVGNYNECVWIRKVGASNWVKIDSYWKADSGKKVIGDANETSWTNNVQRKEFSQTYAYGESSSTTIREIVYANPKYINVFPGFNVGYKVHKCIIDVRDSSTLNNPEKYEYRVGRCNSDGTPMEGHISDIQTFTIYPATYKPVIYQITDQQGFHWLEYQAWAAAAKEVNDRINSDLNTPGIIPVLLNTGDMTQNGTRINEWLDYYRAGYCLFNHLEQVNCVGNNDLGNIDETALGTGDDPGKSNPHFYNICYCYEIPIVLNNDSTEAYLPIICANNGPIYIPSLYYLDFGYSEGATNTKFRLIIGNTEITGEASYNLFGLTGNSNGVPDIYTGFTWTSRSGSKFENDKSDYSTQYLNLNDTLISTTQHANHYIYEILHKWLQISKSDERKVIFACHEMPFTVITAENLRDNVAYYDRSISAGNDALVGCHCNRIGNNTKSGYLIRNKGTYWLSRLLEFFNVKYCLGGHKHTYACTWPLREYYYYQEGLNLKNSLADGPMNMPQSFSSGDPVYFLVKPNSGTGNLEPVIASEGYEIVSDASMINLTKFPITYSGNFTDHNINGQYTNVAGNNIVSITEDTYNASPTPTYVIYFMLQATGFKLKSNKELPGPLQRFSQVIPQSTIETAEQGGSYTITSSKPNKSQIYPMFSIVDVNTSTYATGLNIKLIAIANIVPNNVTAVLNQQTAYSTDYTCTQAPALKYYNNTSIPYGSWGTDERSLSLHIH